MSALGHHIRTHLQDNRVILRSANQQRVLSRVVLEQGRRDGLLGFSMPDTHLHLQALCSERAASRLSQRIAASLKQRLALPVSFVTYPHQPIRSQRHLFNSLRYLVTQHEHHGVELRSSLEASNIPDLLGLRLVGRYTRDNLRRCLPRLQRATLLEWLGLSGLRPADGPTPDLIGATLAAAALPSLHGKSRPVVQARRAFLEVVGDRLSSAESAHLLGVTRRAVTALKSRTADPDLVQAIRLQLGLNQLLRPQR